MYGTFIVDPPLDRPPADEMSGADDRLASDCTISVKDSRSEILYIPGRIVHHAAATYRGDGKTDAKNAAAQWI